MNLHYLANDFLQKEMCLPSIMQQSSQQQQFLPNSSIFNDLGLLQQQKQLNLNNNTDNSIEFPTNISTNSQQSINFFFPSQHMINAINNGISSVSYTQQPQRTFQSSFIGGNNQQSVRFFFLILWSFFIKILN